MKKEVPKTIRSRVERLRREISRLRARYHIEDVSEISDSALDSLKHELSVIEQQYPELVVPDSPTQTVAGAVKTGFKKVRHAVAQWSFSDIFTEEELSAFNTRLCRSLGVQQLEYLVEDKIDGVKIILTYEKGALHTAATRGDGQVGEDITANILTIDTIPRILPKRIDCIVEGEVYLPITAFKQINRERKKEGEEPYANPRNLVAGSLRQLDPAITAKRELRVFLYDIAKHPEVPKTQEEVLETLASLKFPVNPSYKKCNTLEEILMFWKEREKKREKLGYWIDGVVIKVNRREYQQKLGYTGKAPRYATAFKFPPEQATTILKDVVFQVGRTGIITPVAELSPVGIAGTTVSRATLHNEDQIQRLDVRIGDTVIVQKAGDIIPEVVSVVKNLRPKNTKRFVWPKKIPLCGGDGTIVREEGSAAWRCANRSSPELLIQRFAHFTSKNAVGIDGLGERTIRQLVNEGLVTEYADLFTLKRETLLKLEGFKEISVDNLLQAIEARRTIPLPQLLFGLSIDGVGEETATLLAQKFSTFEAFLTASKQEVTELHGVGEVVAEAIQQWKKDTKRQQELKALVKQVEILPTEKRRTEHPLSGKRVVITGTLEGISRTELKKQLRQHGVQVSDTVTKHTEYLLAGEGGGSKREKAQELEIPILEGTALQSILEE